MIADQFEYAEFNGDVHFFCFRTEIPFLGKFAPKNQNYQFELKFGTCTNLNMQNQWWYSLFPFLTKNTFFGKIWSKKSKLSVGTEIWYLDYAQFEYAQFNGDAGFFCFRPKITFLDKFGPRSQNCQFKLKFNTYNHFYNILRLSDVLPNFPFTTSETMRDYKYGMYELPNELSNDLRLRIFGN